MTSTSSLDNNYRYPDEFFPTPRYYEHPKSKVRVVANRSNLSVNHILTN